MNGWKYTPDWSEEDLLNGSYCGFVYMFHFTETDDVYFGAKQIYQRVKDAKKIKDTSKENGWREYSSSSKTVNERIANGDAYTRIILWAFPTMRETLLIESMLILNHILDINCLNKAIMNKVRSPSYEDKKRLKGILTNIIEGINI